MAKNVEQIKNEVIAFMDSHKSGGWDSDMGRVPLMAGQVITLTGEVALQKSTTPSVPDWLAFMTTDGYPIGLRQLFRRGNGLNFGEARTPKEAAIKLLDKVAASEGGLSLTLNAVRKIESSTRNGKNTYYIFMPIEI